MKHSPLNFFARFLTGVLGASLVVGTATLVLDRLVVAADNPKVTPVNFTVSDSPVPRESVGKTTTSYAPVVKKVAECVVQINVSTKSKNVPMRGQQMPFDEDFMQRFFGGQPNPGQGQGQGGQGRTYQTPRQYGMGSGVVVTKDGYILTNNHVVENADDIKVVLTNKREFAAKVVGRDPKTDVAVLKIDGKNLPFMTITDSDKIEVGDLCLAIGNPFGIGQTVTMGIVSAMGRGDVGVGAADGYEDFIQTDAAINPGNSGGALVDTEGRLIGINTAILSRSGGNQGIGFAVPVNMAREVMDSLITKGKVVRGYLGVNIQDVTPGLADEFKLKDQQGSLVADVQPNTPAEKSGLKSGDVILDFNGKPVTDTRHLKLQVAETAPDATVPVKILRDGKEQTLKVTVGELPGSEQVAKNDTQKDSASDTLNGVTVSDINPQLKRQLNLNLPANLKGAVVTDVDQNSVAYEAGIRPGVVIQEINHSPVKTAEDAVKLTENVKEKKTLLKVWSNGGSHYVVVDESKAG